MSNILFRSQAIVQLFVGLGAVASGVLLIIAPSGSLLQMSPGQLQGTPFSDFLVPGVILVLVNGVGQCVAGFLSFRKHRSAGYVGAVFGFGLMIWIFVQVNLIGGGHWLQYSYFALGVLETALAFLVQDHLSATSTRAGIPSLDPP